MPNFPKFWIVAFAGASLSIGISSHFHYGNVQENGILTFLGIFLVYNHYLLTENKRPILIRIAMLVLLLITLGLAIQIASTFVSFFTLVLSGIIGVLYSFKIKTSSVAIRDIPFLKIGLVVGIWTFVCCIFPWFNSPINGNFSSALLLHFFYVFAIALAFDIRDINTDSSKRKTIPQVIGIKPAKAVVIISLVFFFIGSTVIPLIPNYKDLFILAIGTPIITLLVQKDIRPKVYGILLEMSLLMLGISYFSL
jgi:hypothetical protein